MNSGLLPARPAHGRCVCVRSGQRDKSGVARLGGTRGREGLAARADHPAALRRDIADSMRHAVVCLCRPARNADTERNIRSHAG